MDLRTMLGHLSLLQTSTEKPELLYILLGEGSAGTQGCKSMLAWEKGLERKPTAFKTLKCNKNVLNPLKSIAARGICKASNFQLLQGILKTDLTTTR